ncbi:MAG: hypothetical protein KDE35_00145 [Geminicoccaceae bacterium]|nr:hypothetical protein [Geminicoccaceae bacterium]
MAGARRRFVGAAGCVVLALPVLIAASSTILAQTVPQYGDDVHLGVASCASSTCHGAVDPLDGTTVLQNEFATWQKRDKHADAYNLLFDDLSQRIARNLGLDDASTADICLDCHADNVPPERRGPRFQLSDGVGCEACHGGSERWIGPHTGGERTADDGGRAQHEENLALGLYPTSDPAARAELCLSCHIGDETKLATHRIMGAGHPRLSFELDTFTAIEPAHYRVDDDYIERKGEPNGAEVWAIGQAEALEQVLDLVVSRKYGQTGLFPELFFFDCHACHKPMSAARWQERASLGLGPGVVRFNDANLIMLRIAAEAVDPALAKTIAQRGRALHKASQQGAKAWRDAAAALREATAEAIATFERTTFDEPIMRRILDGLVQEGVRGEYVDYVAAEQTTMAISTVVEAMSAEGDLSDAEYGRFEQIMNDLYAAVAKDEQYRPSVHLKALKRIATSGS